MNVLLDFDYNDDGFDVYKIYYNHVLVARIFIAENKEKNNSVLNFEPNHVTAIMLATINIKLFEYFGADLKFRLLT